MNMVLGKEEEVTSALRGENLVCAPAWMAARRGSEEEGGRKYGGRERRGAVGSTRSDGSGARGEQEEARRAKREASK